MQQIIPWHICPYSVGFTIVFTAHLRHSASSITALHVQELRALHLDCTIAKGKKIGSDFEFLPTFPELRELTLEGLDCVSDSLTEAVLAMPKLEQLRFIRLQDLNSSGPAQLAAKARAQRPGLRIAWS